MHPKKSDKSRLPMLKAAAPIVLGVCVFCLHRAKNTPRVQVPEKAGKG